MEKEKIIIVGAGIAGLVLAGELAGRFDITLLEARKTAGGRIQTIYSNDFPLPLEAGAEFIHGQLKYTMALLKEARIKYEATEGKMYRKQDGKWKEQDDMIEGWEELMKKMKKLEVDMTLHDFLKEYFDEEKYRELRRHATAFAEGYDVADTTKVSTKALYQEWSGAGEENFRIPAGYGALVSYLLQQNIGKGCRVIYGETVKQVRWKKNEVSVHTANSNQYTCNKLFITLPVSLLQDTSSPCSINFTPALHKHVKAASQIGFGTVIKIILLFKEPFWEKDSGFIFSDELIPTWWTQLPDTTPLLTGWAGGTQAATLANESKEGLLKMALGSLSNIFDIPIEQLERKLQSSYVANWQKNEWAAGAYSFATPQTKAARKLLNEPVDDSIYFCGEGIYDGDAPGTVEASIAHAMEMAKKLKM
jgi:monoamine oxidase